MGLFRREREHPPLDTYFTVKDGDLYTLSVETGSDAVFIFIDEPRSEADRRLAEYCRLNYGGFGATGIGGIGLLCEAGVLVFRDLRTIEMGRTIRVVPAETAVGQPTTKTSRWSRILGALGVAMLLIGFYCFLVATGVT